MKKNSERVVLVTGGAGGLGRMTAICLAEVGWQVAFNYRFRSQAAADFLQYLEKRGFKAASFQADVSAPQEAQELVTRVASHFGRLDALIHAVGPFIRERRRFADYTIAEIEEMIDGNLRSALITTHAALPYMRQQNFGRIILFGFGRAGEAPAWPDRTAYAAAKSGLVSFTKSLAVEEAPYGITVNMVSPGDIVGLNKEKRIAEVRELTDHETPLGRPGAGEDIARVIRFLCEEDSDFVTGSIIDVTGGLDVIHPVSKADKR